MFLVSYCYPAVLVSTSYLSNVAVLLSILYYLVPGVLSIILIFILILSNLIHWPGKCSIMVSTVSGLLLLYILDWPDVSVLGNSV